MPNGGPHHLQRPVGIVLAGGRSSRMGGVPKAMMPLAGKPLLAHVIDRLAPQVADLALSGDPASPDLMAFGRAIEPDPVPDYAGPLAGLLAGLNWARANHPLTKWLLSAACDTPFLPCDLGARLLEAAPDGETIALPSSGGRLHPVAGLWPVFLADDLAHHLTSDPGSIQAFVARHPHAVLDFTIPDGRDPFLNINTPEDLRRAETLMREAP